MSENQQSKLEKKGLSTRVAISLVTSGLVTPKLIKAATAQELEDAVGSENVSTVEQLFNIAR